MATASRHREHLALAVMDVDDLKFTNDRYGHPQGDARTQARRRHSRPGEGGRPDLPHRRPTSSRRCCRTTTCEGARTFAQRLQLSMHEAGIQLSIGISVLRPDQSGDALRAEADAALYEAKRRGGSQFAHFDDVSVSSSSTHWTRKRRTLRPIDSRNVDHRLQPSGTCRGCAASTRSAQPGLHQPRLQPCRSSSRFPNGSWTNRRRTPSIAALSSGSWPASTRRARIASRSLTTRPGCALRAGRERLLDADVQLLLAGARTRRRRGRGSPPASAAPPCRAASP